MKNIFNLIFILLLLITVSCNKEDNSTQPLDAKTFTIDASKVKWVYFSFDKGDTIQVVNPSKSNIWDLAFNEVNIRTNSGLSGNGTGGAYATGKKETSGFDSVKVVLTEMNCTVDSVYSNVMSMSGHGYKTDTVNQVLNSWYSYNFSTHKINPSNEIFVVRTASGKHAKVWFKSYYKAEDASLGYITFVYKYQSDGSTNLE
jgi:hypothetical protein